MKYPALFLSLLFFACSDKEDGVVDVDNDGFSEAEDCNDFVSSVNPSASDLLGDDIDQNCDGIDGVDGDGDGIASLSSGGTDCDDADAEVTIGATWYADLDGDGFGNDTDTVVSCEQPSGSTAQGGDCDDLSAAVNPDAVEVCDGLDNDCDTAVDDADEDVESSSLVSVYADLDSDGFGDPSTEQLLCDAPEASVDNGLDCDDSDPTIMPGAEEQVADGIDQDCDQQELCYLDEDLDGYGSELTATISTDANGSYDCALAEGASTTWDDCDDIDPTVNPGALTMFADADADGFGSSTAVSACDEAASMNSADCDDSSPVINPNATDLSGDSIDQNCDGVDGIDADSDGYASVVSGGLDCDDTDATTNPLTAEVCDGVDNNCDGLVDDDDPAADTTGGVLVYADVDEDGYGDPNMSMMVCLEAVGYVADSSDCDDTNVQMYPGAAYNQDGNACLMDGDGDGWAPEASCYSIEMYDSFGDGWNGNAIDIYEDGALMHTYEMTNGNYAEDTYCATESAELEFYFVEGSWTYEVSYVLRSPDGTELLNESPAYNDGELMVSSIAVAEVIDCDDSNPLAFPGAAGNDSSEECMLDGDGDGYGDANPGGIIEPGSDCDDSNVAINLTATDLVGDSLDQNCDDLDGMDLDGDGYASSASGGLDCDDGDPAINPDASENVDGIDEDCDGLTDEGTNVYDDDGDSFPEDGGDCNDEDNSIYPGALETCDGIDNDCDGLVDDADSDLDTTGLAVVYFDGDGDGYGDPSTAQAFCVQPAGYVSDSTDCNDADAVINPGGSEFQNGLDDDCDGLVDEGTNVYDDDGDGFSELDGDCDDTNPSIVPFATELENGIDDDCDGVIDQGTNAYDDDNDGYSENNGDCDDSDPFTWPNAAFLEANSQLCMTDGDGDGYGDASATLPIIAGTDCDDAEPGTYPAATELINGVDDNCDGVIDEGTNAFDDDGDGYSENAGDCDDSTASTFPSAPELVNGIDDDCDGVIDEGTNAFDDDGDGYSENDGDCDDGDAFTRPNVAFMEANSQLCMTDADGDGYGDASVSGPINVGLDCDDGDAGINPDASENADGIDEDCDGLTDEGTNVYDDDGDSYPEDGGDCNDEDNSIYPGAPEVCDGIDNDCDGLVDDADAGLDTSGLTVMYLDGDGDGYGDLSTGQPFCVQPLGYVTNSTDCNDLDPAVNPGGSETLNNIDDDCDGLVDEGTVAYDDDGDGYSENAGDCDDSTASINPGALENENGLDDDCDGIVDEETNAYDDDNDGYSENDGDCDDSDPFTWPNAAFLEANSQLCMTDADGDGYGDINGFNPGTDCDDSDPGINPSASESSNGVDDNCNGQIDEGIWDGLVYFDNCAQTGPSGPSQAACDRIYGGTTLDGLVTVSAGIQYWTVPFSGTYEIFAAGAEGGGSGGSGALMSGSFQLQSGDVLKIVVGQMGGSAPASVGNGGGGGTFVAFSDNTPLIVAGGGGGTGHNNSYSGNSTLNGVTSTSGVTGLGGNPGSGGSNGNGGDATNGNANTANAAGGGGFYSDGGSSSYGAGGVNGGRSFINGANGGDSTGGFGGGGGSNYFVYGCSNSAHGGSGGGGYSGGGGGGSNCNGGGGGGGSYNSGSNQSNSAGANGGHGYVTIDLQ